jgi:futalosine hydrolase
MRMIIVAATAVEAASLGARLGAGRERSSNIAEYAYAGHEVHVLVAGVGMVATAVWSSQALMQAQYDIALNMGLCGSFDRSLTLGTVVHVVSDRIAELGAEDGDRFLPLGELGLLEANDVPYTQPELVNARPPVNGALDRLPKVKGITVNTVHGAEQSIAAVVERFKPQVESMEGAAFMYACLVHDVTFAQVRAVSNVVERRDRARWKVSEAIDALGAAVFDILDAS